MNSRHFFSAIVPRLIAGAIALFFIANCFVSDVCFAQLPQRQRRVIRSKHAVKPVVMVIRSDADGLAVEAKHQNYVEIESGSSAIVIWSDGGVDRWQLMSSGQLWKRPSSYASGSSNGARQAAVTRGLHENGGGLATGQMTLQLDQLMGQVVFRGSSFITPANGFLLDGRITIRRSLPVGQQASSLPAEVGRLTQGNKIIAEIALAGGQQTIQYAEMGKLPELYPSGLPAGEYTLRVEGGGDSSTFTIEEVEWRDQVMDIPNRIATSLGNKSDLVYLQVTAETLLNQFDEYEKPLAYLSDALQVLDSVPASDLSPYLTSLRQSVLNQLVGDKGDSPTPSLTATDAIGIESIDTARSLISRGDWQAALDSLETERLIEKTNSSDRESDHPRVRALATLYRAVILAESGLGNESEARQAFVHSIQQIKKDSPGDLFRAHNNFANFFLNNAQDRLYNHAFQISTGAETPIIAALSTWLNARDQFDIAAGLVGTDMTREAGIQVNQSRLYSWLSDLIRTLDVPVDNQRQLVDLEEAASEKALALADQASDTLRAGDQDQLALASAEEIQAQIAYRRHQSQSCVAHANNALQAYLDVGSLAGVEGIYRLLGLYYMNVQQFEGDGTPSTATTADTKATRQTALNHFLVSNALAEFLRERLPSDAIGLSQSGFFARRAYVNEKIIELLIGNGNSVEALKYAELAKARSLQDLLIFDRTVTLADSTAEARATDEILAQWPANVAAIEYFVGSEKVWLFLIDTAGNVSAYDLLGSQGKSQNFIRDISQYLDGSHKFVKRMKVGLFNGKGFDHQWQDDLHEFYQLLLPSGVLEKLRGSATVVVVPHHVLHYFPFAALVTQLDERDRDPYEMVQPQFLIDESFNLIHAPSIGVWDWLRTRTNRPLRQASAVGVDFPGALALPGVELDMNNLKAAFGANVGEVLFGNEANETNVLPLLARPGLLLFATHGTNFADNPLSSHLLLFPDRLNDGRLTARELFTSPVNSDLIVLSACHSGLADRSPLPGDDLFGIQRALLQSGARSVVSGLWEVYDDTAPELMKGLFDRLAIGQPVAKALAESQREFLTKRRSSEGDPWLHPYFWSVYKVSGDDRTFFRQD